MKTSTIKHKLWGKLKKEAHNAYKIVPAKDSELYNIKHEETGYIHSNYTLKEAIELVEVYRSYKFKKLCYQALYKRRKKRIKNL